jgi:glucokinase
VTPWRLLSDVGGTNVRFARAFGESLLQRCSYPVSDFATFLQALRDYVDQTGGPAGCIGAAIGAAGPLALGAVRLTNVPWVICEAEVSSEINAPCILVNDVEAAAFCLPTLSYSEYAVLGRLAPNLTTAHRLLAANIGTGFGAATLVRTAHGWISSPSEAGHMSLAFPDWQDQSLRRKFVSVEHALSGRGLSNLYSAVANEPATLAPSEIFARAGYDQNCANALHLFMQILGDVLGNLALAVAAWDGVFLCGSVAMGLAGITDLSTLRRTFENKGPMSDLISRIPLALITKEDAALAGLAVLPLPERS